MAKQDQTKRYYEEHADIWLERKNNSFFHEKQFTALFKHLTKGARVLDIGCAGGIHVPLFLGIGRHTKYEGIDITNKFLKTAQRRYPQLAFSYGDIVSGEGLPKKKYDAFCAVSVLMHAPEDKLDQTLDNVSRLMKPGAYGYLTYPMQHPSGEHADQDARHFTLLSEAEQKSLFKRHHWKILKSGNMDGFSTPNVWKWYLVQLP